VILQLYTLKGDLSSLLGEMMLRAFILLVKNMTSKMILGVELLISMLLEIQLLPVSSTTNIFMFSQEEQSLTKRK
jgi:hypothetical protein